MYLLMNKFGSSRLLIIVSDLTHTDYGSSERQPVL